MVAARAMLAADGARVRVTSEVGTDLRMSIGGREAHGRKGGIYREPGHWGNLPCGEAFVAPVEGSAEGVYVVELGIGCNGAATIGGVILEDEKALGSCHIALGSNAMFGGRVRVASHLDGVLLRPTIRLDGATLLERGEHCGGREGADGHV